LLFHEKWLDDPSVFDQKLPRLEAIWKQIATRFSAKGENLLFEVFNEPNLMTAEQLNAMNRAVLPIIRVRNPVRIVLLMGLQHGNPTWILQNPDALEVPEDKQVMLEIHNDPITI
jgi:endoglucanase